MYVGLAHSYIATGSSHVTGYTVNPDLAMPE